jgi:hypothetical protein
LPWTSLFAQRFERYDLCGKEATFGIHHLDQHLVLAARQVNQDDGVALAVIRPLSRQVVDGNVQMTDARGQVSCGRPAHGQDAQVLHPVRDKGDAAGERNSLAADSSITCPVLRLLRLAVAHA